MTSKPRQPLLLSELEEILRIYENNHVDPPWSHLVVLSLDVITVGLLAWCVLQFVESRRAAEQAKQINDKAVPLFDGARFVSGRVELADGETTAVRVTIKQEGTESETKNGHVHRWTEIDRQVEARPFYLRRANGDRIRVEPPIDVMLVDKLDQTEWYQSTQRRKRAELSEGETAIIEGVLTRGSDPEALHAGQGYRGSGASGWIMHGSRKRGMSISTESLSRRHELRALAWRKTTIFCALVGALAFGCNIVYRASVLRGTNVTATYVGKGEDRARDSRGRLRINHYAKVDYTDETGRTTSLHLDVDAKDYAWLPKENRPIWLRYVPAYPWATSLGRGSSVFSITAIAAAILIGVSALSAMRTHRYRRWYEGHVAERGQGPLPTPPNVKFVENERRVMPQKVPRPQGQAPIDAEFEKDKPPGEIVS